MNISFEQSLAKMEEILTTMERGDTSLDESIVLFQEGIQLSKHCTEKLQEVEKQIEILTEDGNDLTVRKANIKEK